jgi:hypothetical protein
MVNQLKKSPELSFGAFELSASIIAVRPVSGGIFPLPRYE